MSFHLATVNDSLSPARATNFRNVRMGGPSGLIARYVGKLGTVAEHPWHIGEMSLVELAGGTGGYDLIFFRPTLELSPDGSLEIYRLGSLHGVSSADRTDVVCHFSPLVMRESGSGVWDIGSSAQRVLCESLSLSGGILRGRWQWTESPMTLGATVVGGKGGCCSTPAASACCGGCR